MVPPPPHHHHRYSYYHARGMGRFLPSWFVVVVVIVSINFIKLSFFFVVHDLEGQLARTWEVSRARDEVAEDKADGRCPRKMEAELMSPDLEITVRLWLPVPYSSCN